MVNKPSSEGYSQESYDFSRERFKNPIFGVLLSAAILGETEGFGWNYIAALIVISVGITFVTRKQDSYGKNHIFGRNVLKPNI